MFRVGYLTTFTTRVNSMKRSIIQGPFVPKNTFKGWGLTSKNKPGTGLNRQLNSKLKIFSSNMRKKNFAAKNRGTKYFIGVCQTDPVLVVQMVKVS